MKKVVVISTSLRPGYRPPDIEELHEATIEILGGLSDLFFSGEVIFPFSMWARAHSEPLMSLFMRDVKMGTSMLRSAGSPVMLYSFSTPGA